MIALFSALLSRLTVLACGSTWVTSLVARFCFVLNIHWSGVLTALAWLVPHETAAISVQVLCTPYNHAPCHFKQSHIRKMYACLAVTCHLHFWQNDRDLLRATVVTWGWNGYQHGCVFEICCSSSLQLEKPYGEIVKLFCMPVLRFTVYAFILVTGYDQISRWLVRKF